MDTQQNTKMKSHSHNNFSNHWTQKLYSLPVYTQKTSILAALKTQQIVIVESNTGSGKTTQLPIILYEAGYTTHCCIGVTQPRRIAAFSVSDIINAQIHQKYTQLPESFVRYKIRFDDTTTIHTKIKIMTDGVLLQEIKNDPLLLEYSVLIIDEAHERSLNIDFILGLLKNLCKIRPDLKIIISSATIDTKAFSTFFTSPIKSHTSTSKTQSQNAPIVKINAPLHKVKTLFLPTPVFSQNNSKQNVPRRYNYKKKKNVSTSFSVDDSCLIDHIVSCVESSVAKREGDILIFLSGEKQIHLCTTSVLPKSRIANSLLILPLYGRLDKKAQEQVFMPTPAGKTKVVVATNIAETSITINDIAVVIDAGRAKINTFLHSKFASSLKEKQISKASAIQRHGRAGRTKDGTCYRLYTKKEFSLMCEYSEKEICRTDLSEVVLRMAHLDIQDFNNFPFISSPPAKYITAATQTLKRLGALDEKQIITSIGKTMCNFPLSPAHARVVIEAMQHFPNTIYETLIVISFLTTPNPFLLPMDNLENARKAHRHFANKTSSLSSSNDFLLYLHLFNNYIAQAVEDRLTFCTQYFLDTEIMKEVHNVHSQLAQLVEDHGIPVKPALGPSFVNNSKQNLNIIDKQIVPNVMKSILRGLENNICIKNPSDKRGHTYINRSEEKIFIHPGALLFDSFKTPQIIVAAEIINTSRFFARSIAPCEIHWLKDSAPVTYAALYDIHSKKHKHKF